MKKWFASCKYIKPADLEEFLENCSRDGYHIIPIGQMGFFHFEFIQTEPQKYRYVVDVTALPKVLYMETIVEKGWEYLGKTGNCYVWRKPYEERRPDSFADKACIRKHCLRVGIAAILAMLLCLGAAGYLIYGAYLERKLGFDRYYLSYLIEALPLIPLGIYFGWAARKLLR